MSSTQTVEIDPRLGEEFEINTATQGAQDNPAVAALAGGGFAAVWESPDQDKTGIFGQRFNARAKPRGDEFQVNSHSDDDQTMPALAGLAADGFVTAWASDKQDGDGTGVFGQRFGGKGTARGGEFQANSFTVSDQLAPAAAGLAGGGHVLLWSSKVQESHAFGLKDRKAGIVGRLYSETGKAVGKEFHVNTVMEQAQTMPAVAALRQGGFVAIWVSEDQDGSGLGVFGQRFNRKAVAKGGEFQVNTETAGDQSVPSVAGLADGGFVVTWQSAGQDGSGLGVYGQRFGAGGKAKGGEFQVNTTTRRDQWQPAVAADLEDGFLIAWTSKGQDGSGQGVFGQRFDAKGGRIDEEFPINATTRHDQWQPGLTTLEGGDMIAVWTSLKQDGSKAGIYGRRLRFSN